MDGQFISMKPRILLVDDRPGNLAALEGLLDELNLVFVRALSGNEALRLTLKQDFALVLMDVQMPEMDGFETAELMRSNPKTRHLPIIFVTAGMKELKYQFKGYDAGAVDYMAKPIEPVILRSKVRVFRDLYLQRMELEFHRKNLQELVDQRTIQLRLAAQELEQRVIERTEELQQLNRQLESFAYSVSHDLRAPLRHIDAFSHILMDDYSQALDGEARGLLHRIVAGCDNMGKLIDAILALSRTVRQPINKMPVSMERLARETFAQCREQYEGKEVEFAVSELPESQADPILVRQVYANLIGNALKYSSRREMPKIEVGAFPDKGETVYFVRDNGVGFDMRYADKLFAVFQRLHNGNEYEGTGVGLAIAQNIIQRHGGKIWAEAEPDRGATFFFTL
ncbi:response regulator [Geobacter hydrogenophilus]|uniref:histidine kinase n=2 Tax=Geobacter hydrogenophilus TaxID=40983 RepID=A0A9W6G3S6_9BACT|nr:response regulator [Geobacter hydrogenophilus]MBT0892584.1 response regulator [Geobacter hydrogenophilus]GLI39981.1 hybrid sensor histidine kinase/response regulator [Geobacter hydrogenophilus]